jgi:hypothetical protein
MTVRRALLMAVDEVITTSADVVDWRQARPIVRELARQARAEQGAICPNNQMEFQPREAKKRHRTISTS